MLPAGADGAVPDGGSTRGADRPGTAYLLHRRTALSRREAALAAGREAAARLDDALAALSVAVDRPPPAGYPGRGDQPMPLLRVSYLVDTDRTDEFTASVRAMAAELPALRVRLTGPWPAYSFVAATEVDSR